MFGRSAIAWNNPRANWWPQHAKHVELKTTSLLTHKIKDALEKSAPFDETRTRVVLKTFKFV